MHGQSIGVADPDYHVAKHQASSVGVDLDGHDLAVLYAQVLSVLCGGVDVALRGDDALCNLNLALGPTILQGALPAISPDSLTGAATPMERASVRDSST